MDKITHVVTGCFCVILVIPLNFFFVCVFSAVSSLFFVMKTELTVTVLKGCHLLNSYIFLAMFMSFLLFFSLFFLVKWLTTGILGYDGFTFLRHIFKSR